MKRLPLVMSFILFIVLCISVAYWALQLFKPPLRPVAAPPRAVQAPVRTEAATALFGGRAAPVAVASNYQLKGVIFSSSPHDSVAIISADGKPPQAVRIDREVMPGVTVKEVHREYVLLLEGGATKRIDLPESEKIPFGGITSAPVPMTTAQASSGPSMPLRSQAAGTGISNSLSSPTPPQSKSTPVQTPPQQAQTTQAPNPAPATAIATSPAPAAPVPPQATMVPPTTTVFNSPPNVTQGTSPNMALPVTPIPSPPPSMPPATVAPQATPAPTPSAPIGTAVPSPPLISR